MADFQTANPNVKINIQSIQNEDLDGKLQTALNSGDAPDIFLQRGGGKMAAMVEAGQVMDITDSITDETKQASRRRRSKTETIDGKIYAMPVSILPGGFFYSKDLFTQGRHHDDADDDRRAEAAVDKLKATGVTPIALGAKDAWPAAHWYYFFALRECSTATLDDRPPRT